MTASAMTPAAAQAHPKGAFTAMMLGNLMIGAGILAPAAMLNELTSGLNVNAATAGQLVGYGALVLCAGAPLFAYLTRNVPRRSLLVAALVLYGVGHIASAYAPDFQTLLIIRLLMISGAAIFTPQAAATTGLLAPPDKRAAMVTYVFLGWSLASAFGMLAMSLGGHAFGWRAAYELMGVLCLAAAAGVFFTLPAGLKTPALPLSAWGQVVTNKPIMLVVSVTALTLAGQFALFPYLAAELKSPIGASAQQVAILLSVYGFSSLFGASLATRLVGRLGAPMTQAACLVCIAAGLTLWALIARDVVTAGIAIAVWGFAFSAANGLQQARLIAIAPPLSSASVSLNTSAIYVGQAAGAAIGGALLVAGSDRMMAPVGVALMLCAIAASLLAQRWFKA